MPTILQRFQSAYNAFRDRDPTQNYVNIGPSYSSRSDRSRLTMGTEKSVAAPIYTRIGIDVSAIPLRHVRLDQDGRYIQTIDSGLNNCLSIGANIDQTGRAFIQDVVLSMLGEGVVAIVAVDTTIDPAVSSSWDVLTMRVGKVIDWYPYHVRLSVYNEKRGMQEEITLPKKDVVIIENPLYAVMNEPNSTLKRLIRKLNLLDVVDDQSGSNQLDLIIQVPYTARTQLRKEQAETRKKEVESQLRDSKYGIAYIDATEKITQLNRPASNNLMGQIEFLTRMLNGQLGITDSVLMGTADEKEMLNYHSRTIEPILNSIADGLIRTFLTKTARSQGQSIKYFKDPFALVQSSNFGTLVDSLTRNAVLTSNEVRQSMGFKPSSDAEADTLRNKNLNPSSSQLATQSSFDNDLASESTQ